MKNETGERGGGCAVRGAILAAALASLALLGGCRTSQMKSTPFYSGSDQVYTGKPEDRVNLWPIAYYREPALSVIWPLFSQTDDHLAVRPLYSQYRQGGKGADYDEFNFLWPFCQFDTRRDEHRIFPVFWGDGYVDLFPLVWWRFGHSFTLFPLVWWGNDRYFNVFPLWWSGGHHQLLIPLYYRDGDSIQVIPFYGSTRHGDGFTQWIGPYGRYRDRKHPEWNYDWCLPFYYRDATSFETPLFGWDRGDSSSWAFPFYYKDKDTFLSPVWYSQRDGQTNGSSWAVPPLLSWGWSDGDGSCDEYLLGLAGRGTDAAGGDRYWTFPLFYHDDRTFLSTFWCAWQDEQATTDSWVVPPLLTWGASGEKGWSQRYLLGLAGVEREKDGGYADWLAPLYYRNEGNFLSLPYCSFMNGAVHLIPPLLTSFDGSGVCSPLFGWSDSCSWAVPFWYRDGKTFATLPVVVKNEVCGASTNRTVAIPPLLSWFRRRGSDGHRENRLLLGLAGWDSDPGNAVADSWIIPLYYHDSRWGGGCVISLPFAHTSEFTYLTPLIGMTHQEHRKGAWLWPLFGWTGDDRMDEAERMLDAETLDPKVSVELQESKLPGYTNRVLAVRGAENAHEESWRLSGLSTGDHWISWSAHGTTVTGREESDFGNFLAYKSERTRTVKFDSATKRKISDEERGESGLLCNFLWHSKHEAGRGREYDMKSILWRFWHYEKLNGDVTVDSFPFFTYDSKTNGFSKTSLFWRLFRNEYDPQKGRAVDVLFIPVWR